MRSMNSMTPTATLYVVVLVMNGEEDTVGAFQSEQDAQDAINTSGFNRMPNTRAFIVATPYFPTQAR